MPSMGGSGEYGGDDPTGGYTGNSDAGGGDDATNDILAQVAVNTPWDTQGLMDAWAEYEAMPNHDGWEAYTGNLFIDFVANVIAWGNSPTPPADLSTAINSGQLPSDGGVTSQDVANAWNGQSDNASDGGTTSGDGTSDGTPDTSEESKPGLKDIIMDSIQSQTQMSEEQWATVKPFWEQMFSEDNLGRMDTAQGQGYDALSQLFGETTTTSPFEQAVQDYGMDWLRTGSDIMSGNYQLPAGLVNKRQDEWDILREATSRGGTFISPEGVATSTPGAQQVGQFNRTWNEREDAFGLGLLGLANQGGLGAFGQLSSNKANEYSNLFGGMQSLLNPTYGSASGLTSAASGNAQGAGNTALNLLNANNWMSVNKPSEDDFWGDLFDFGSDIYTQYSWYNRFNS